VTTHATSARRVLGRYEMGPAIGRGATAVVHRARDLTSGEDVAVKAVPVELGLAPRVRAEVRAASRLDHPGVVPLLDWGEDRDCLYLVWELVEGRSLAEWLRAPDPPGDDALVRVAADVLAALAHAHGRGVVHRDVKPGNILIDAAGRARLTDFGVARLSGESGLTLTGGVVGTVAYMAPEQARGEGAGPESDVYSACLVLYEGLTGANPVAGASPAETARRAASAAVPPLSRVRPDLPAPLLGAVEAGLRPGPSARPPAARLAADLRDLRTEAVAAARRTGRRWLPAAACAVAGGALAAVALARGSGQLADWVSVNWHSGGTRALAVLLAAAAFAWRPRVALLAAIVIGAALVGAVAPAAGAILGALALLVALTGLGWGRLALLPLAAPVLFVMGLGPLYPAVAGLVPRWPGRLWAAVSGMVAAAAWALATGSGGLPIGGGQPAPAVAELAGGRSPVAAADRLWQPLADRPEIALQALAMAVAAMCVPLVLRAPPGGARIAAAGAWVAALGAALVAVSHDGPDVVAGLVPAALVVMAWAIQPWRSFVSRGPRRSSATLRSPTA
jgi:hypothetical protein